MKSRKKMKHVQLVQEVIQQVKSRFPPKVPDIKKNIEALMEKDYIERLDGDELAYIAWFRALKSIWLATGSPLSAICP